LLALIVVVLIPLLFYAIASRYGVVMPRRFFYDSVTTRVQDGKELTDTVWHRVANISLQNQHCASICPTLTRNMRHLQDGLKVKDEVRRADSSFVQFLSLTVDPAHDSVSTIKKYADRYGVNSDVWWLLTGPKKTIYDFALNELKLGLQDSVSVDSNFVHTDYVALLDKDRVVRGYYHGTDTAAMAKLAEDIVFIMLEKDKKRKSTAFDELKPLLIPIIIIMAAIVLAVVFFSRRQKNVATT